MFQSHSPCLSSTNHLPLLVQWLNHQISISYWLYQHGFFWRGRRHWLRRPVNNQDQMVCISFGTVYTSPLNTLHQAYQMLFEVCSDLKFFFFFVRGGVGVVITFIYSENPQYRFLFWSCDRRLAPLQTNTAIFRSVDALQETHLPDWSSGRLQRVCEVPPASVSTYTEPALGKRTLNK